MLSRTALMLLLAMLFGACSSTGTGDGTEGSLIRKEQRYKTPQTYNFQFRAWDTAITDPAQDRRSYYRVFIDKVEEGRTTTGLESQEKTYEAMLAPNRHLLNVEKWVLDERQGKYVKLNNVEQPRPSFIYFDLPEARIVVVTMKNDGERASFHVEFVKE